MNLSLSQLARPGRAAQIAAAAKIAGDDMRNRAPWEFTGETMNDYYTVKEVMALLGLRSFNALRQLQRKYPAAFVNIAPAHKAKNAWYDKATLDKFAKAYERLKKVKT